MNKSIPLQVGVKIFLKNKTGKCLLLKRSPSIYPQLTNLWDIPGGRIIPGTRLLENLQREVSEETKLEILSVPLLIAAQDIIRGTEKHIVRITFTGETEGEPILNEEHTEYQWCFIRNMLQVEGLDDYTKEVIKKEFRGKTQ